MLTSPMNSLPCRITSDTQGAPFETIQTNYTILFTEKIISASCMDTISKLLFFLAGDMRHTVNNS